MARRSRRSSRRPTPAALAMSQIEEDVGRALDAAGLAPWHVRTVLAPAWTTDWITEAGRASLRAYGIAPPGRCGSQDSEMGASATVRPLRFVPRSIPRALPDATPAIACPPLRQHAYRGAVALCLHGVQGAPPLPGLPRAVRLLRRLSPESQRQTRDDPTVPPAARGAGTPGNVRHGVDRLRGARALRDASPLQRRASSSR